MDDQKLKVIKNKITSTHIIEDLFSLGEKIFKKNDDAVCVMAYMLEQAYILGRNSHHRTAPPDDI